MSKTAKNISFQIIDSYTAVSGVRYENLRISYEVFGKPMGKAPVILINHALTGNSHVTDKGWWDEIVGFEKVIDTRKFTIICFNILGNGYDGVLLSDYTQFTASDMAKLFIVCLRKMGVNYLHAAIGVSLGGGIVWEMAALENNFIEYVIPIAAYWKTTQWVKAITYVQDSLLHNSKEAMKDARMMAMLFYRTPLSLEEKVYRAKSKFGSQFTIHSWLDYHGKTLEKRFCLQAYKTMNHLLQTVDITGTHLSFEKIIHPIQSTIIQIAIDSDIFFIKEENLHTKILLDQLKKENDYYEIKSIHGHDAFLIEHRQLSAILKKILQKIKCDI